MKLAVIGAGKVGSIIVKGARHNSMNVVIGSRTPKGDIDGVKVIAIEEAIKIADNVVIAIPGSETLFFLNNYRSVLVQKTIIE